MCSYALAHIKGVVWLVIMLAPSETEYLIEMSCLRFFYFYFLFVCLVCVRKQDGSSQGVYPIE